MSEYDSEPVRGLPGLLPEGEHILWQSAPDWKRLALSALHIRLAAGYFAVIVGWAIISGDFGTAVGVSLLGALMLAMCIAFAWAVARTTLYTLTNKRIVLRIGVALNKCVNLPLSQIESADLKMLDKGHGSIALTLKGAPRLGYLMLWPHARSLRFMRPQPMLRAIPDAREVAQSLFEATQKIQAIAPVQAKKERLPDRPLVGAAA
jgi:cytochrome b561